MEDRWRWCLPALGLVLIAAAPTSHDEALLPRSASPSRPSCVDPLPPSLPQFTAATPTTSQWSADSRVTIQWLPAADDLCGVDGYGEYWSPFADGCPSQVKDLEELPTQTVRSLPDGTWYYALRTVDQAGNWSTDCARIGPFLIDTLPPGDPWSFRAPSHLSGVWSRSNRIRFTWGALSDEGSQPIQFALRISYGTIEEPDEAAIIGPGNEYLSPELPDRTDIYCSLRARDLAGHWSARYLWMGPFWIDATPPSTPQSVASSTHTVGVLSESRTIAVHWLPSIDTVSGLYGYSFAWSNLPDTQPGGGQAILEPLTTSPALSDGNWWFHLAVQDKAGNRGETVHLGPFPIGPLQPSPPAMLGSSHSPGGCSDDCTVDVQWTSTPGAAGYSLEWDAVPDAVPDTQVDSATAAATSPCLGGGSWYLHVLAQTSAGFWSEPAHFGPFAVDQVAPQNPTSIASSTHLPAAWSNLPVVTLAWDPALDEGCGVAGYSVAFDQQADSVPDAAPETAAVGLQSPGLADGSDWHVHVRAVDAAGHGAVGAVHLGPLAIDTTPPSAELLAPAGGARLPADTDVAVELALSDATSGVETVIVEASLDGGALWTESIYAGTPPQSAPVWRTPDRAVGGAQLRVIAVDRAGNQAVDLVGFAIEAIEPPPPFVPSAHRLGANVPNPFNPATVIPLELPVAGQVRLEVLDLRGRVVAVPLDAYRGVGRHELGWDGRDGEGRPLPSGVYVYRMRAGAFATSRKLAILR